MSSVDDLFERYRSAFQSGEGSDPQPYLEQLEGDERRELEALIDSFLARGARRRFDAETFARMREDPLARRIESTMASRLATQEGWQTLLPRARTRAQVLRADVVKRLAAALGVPDREEKVARYYHEMETGRLEPSGVSERVLRSLGEILGVPAETLREAGRRLAPPAPAQPAAFARSAKPAAAPRSAEPPGAPAQPREWDEVDQLFRGG